MYCSCNYVESAVFRVPLLRPPCVNCLCRCETTPLACSPVDQPVHSEPDRNMTHFRPTGVTGHYYKWCECKNCIYNKQFLLCTYGLYILFYIITHFLSNTAPRTPVPLGAIPYPQTPRWVSAWTVKTFILKPALGLAARSKGCHTEFFSPFDFGQYCILFYGLRVISYFSLWIQI